MDITYSPDQEEAINRIVSWYGDNNSQELLINGYAGTGKTTIVDGAINRIKDKYKKCQNTITCAFTGKAASVMRKKGCVGAMTIHSAIYSPIINKETGKLERFVVSADSPLAEADLAVLDECSMVGDDMAKDFRSFKKKTLIMGDPGQLSPIKGTGAFTGKTPDVLLTQIHRQAAESPILKLATMARNGEPLPIGFDEGGVRVLKLDKDTQTLLYNRDTQPICGKNSVRYAYTQRIRRNRGFDGQEPLVGERIICTRNNKLVGLFNGLMGELISIKPKSSYSPRDSYQMNVRIDDEDSDYRDLIVDPFQFKNHFCDGNAAQIDTKGGKNYFDQFDWGYMITCHKSQGSSFPHITVVDDSGCFRQEAHKWLYTAITRAETGLTLLMR